VIEIDLSKKTILLTGALGAIAQHILKTLLAAGAFLVLTDKLDEAEASVKLATWQLDPGRYVYRQMDVTNGNAVSLVVDEAMDRFPNLDTVLGHAGGCSLHPFATTSEAEFDRIFQFNFLAQTYLARAVLNAWTQKKVPGHLIFTSSYVARVPHTRIPAYATAKAALEGLTKCLALEYAPCGIRVNAVSPGNVAAGSSLKVFNEDSEYHDFVLRVSPLQRRNSPESVADVFLFLASPMANEMTGQVVSVDMGVSIPKIG